MKVEGHKGSNGYLPVPLLREAEFGDYHQIAGLQQRYGLESKSQADWQRLWLDNPSYCKLTAHWPIGWVLQKPDQTIVGYLGNIPLTYELEKKDYLIATTHAWVVDSHYRAYSLLLLDHFFCQTYVDLYLTTTLNSAAYNGFKSFGPSPVPVGEWDTTRFWVTRPRGFIVSYLRLKNVPIADFISYGLSTPWLIKDRLTSRVGKTACSNGDVHIAYTFDDRFDAFWEELRCSRPDVLLGTRNRETLNWHFQRQLADGRAWICYITRNERIIAYSVFYRQDNDALGLRRVRLADFQALVSDDCVLRSMLSAALDHCRRSGIDMLEVMGFSTSKIDTINALAPFRRKLSSWFCFYKANNTFLAERALNSPIWDLCWFDGDASL